MTTHLFSEYYSGPIAAIVVTPTHMEKIECSNTSTSAGTNSASSPCSPPTRSDSAGASVDSARHAGKIRDAKGLWLYLCEASVGTEAGIINRDRREVLAAFVTHCRAKYPVTLGGESLGFAEVEFVKLAKLEATEEVKESDNIPHAPIPNTGTATVQYHDAGKIEPMPVRKENA